MISPGQRIDPSFTLQVVEDGQIRVVKFQELLTRPTIVSVYMRNNTPSCDRQNENLGQVASELERAGYNLVAISRDTAGSHQRYAAAKNIHYILASDPDDCF